MAVRQQGEIAIKTDRLPISNFLYNRATILPQYRGDREEKGLLARSILEIIRRREVYKITTDKIKMQLTRPIKMRPTKIQLTKL